MQPRVDSDRIDQTCLQGKIRLRQVRAHETFSQTTFSRLRTDQGEVGVRPGLLQQKAGKGGRDRRGVG